MKKVLVLSAVLLSLGACSSSQKKEMNDTKENAMAKAEDAKSEAKEAVENAQADAQSEGSKATCKLDEDTRVIEVKKTDGGGCELFYTKFGEAKSVASSGFGTQYCEEVKDRIQSNLNKAGFSCQ